MKNHILSLLAAAVLLPAGITSAATTPQLSFSQGTNVVLTWPSAPGEQFMVLHRRAFHPSTPWKVIATNLPAGPFNLTVFTHVGGVPPYLGAVLNGGGGSGSPPGAPAAATLAAPTTDTTATNDKTKVKQKDEGPPALPDEKELEKQYREWLKESEKQQKNNGNSGGGVQALTATYSLPDSSYTNVSAGFYVLTHTADDTDFDQLPDYWEAMHGLNLLVNDAAEDPDGDGVPNLAEYAYGTNPRDPDSKPVVYVSYTSPVNTNTYFPTVQITGSINLNIRTLLFDVTNAAGVQTDLEAFVTRRTVIPGSGFTNSPARYTNAFQCFDVPLTNGANTIGLRFTDAYGLTFATTVAFTVDFNASPAAPVGTVFWPASGAQIGADTFTLRGRLDNPTASVIARMTIDGEEQELGGLVERDGTFWLEDLPTPTSGTVSLVFTDAGGKASTNTLNLTRSPVSLVLNDPSGPNLWDAGINLNGTVSDPAYSVWVNSTRATVDENGNWTAEGVPLNAGGVASFSVRAVPNSDNGGAGTGGQAMAGGGGLGGLYNAPAGNPGSASAVDAAFDFDKPPRIVVSSYTMRSREDNPTYETGSTNRQTLDWTRSGAGYSGTATSYYETKYPAFPSSVWRQWQTINYPFPGTNGFEFTSGIYTWEEPFSYTNLVGEPGIPWEITDARERTESRNYNEKAQTTLQLLTGGRAVSGAGSVFVFDVPTSGSDVHGTPVSIPPENIKFFGQPLADDYAVGRLNLPANATLDATPVILLAQSFPAGGGRANYNVFDSSSVVRPLTTPYYVTGSRTNREILHLGYSRVEIPYQLTGYGGRTSFHWEQVLGTGKYLVIASNYVSSAVRKYTFAWNGTVPDLPAGPQVRNTRRYVDPTTRELAAAVTTATAYGRNNYQLIGTNKMGLIKTTAKAVVARQNFGDAAHLATIAGSLGAARYTVTQDQNLSLTSVTNNMPLGLVWYSISHGRSEFGDFQGLQIANNQTLAGTNMPGTFNYMLAFLNGCNSANDGATNVTALANSFGPDCAVVGWGGAVVEPVALTAATMFFDRLQRGDSVELALNFVHGQMGTTIAYLGNAPEQRTVPQAFSVFRNGHVIIDLK